VRRHDAHLAVLLDMHQAKNARWSCLEYLIMQMLNNEVNCCSLPAFAFHTTSDTTSPPFLGLQSRPGNGLDRSLVVNRSYKALRAMSIASDPFRMFIQGLCAYESCRLAGRDGHHACSAKYSLGKMSSRR
jgi:hypothetical protein